MMNADRGLEENLRLSSLMFAYVRLCSLTGKKIMAGAARGHVAERGMPGSRGRGRSLTEYLLRAGFKNRPVRGPGLQGFRILAISRRPRAVTRRPLTILKQALRLCAAIRAGFRAGGFAVLSSAVTRMVLGAGASRFGYWGLGAGKSPGAADRNVCATALKRYALRGAQAGFGSFRLGQQKAERGRDEQSGPQHAEGNGDALGFLFQQAEGIIAGPTPHVAEGIHQRHDRAHYGTRQRLSWNGPEGVHRREAAGNGQAEPAIERPYAIATQPNPSDDARRSLGVGLG